MRRFQIVAHPMVFKCLTAIGRDSVKYGDFSVAIAIVCRGQRLKFTNQDILRQLILFFHRYCFFHCYFLWQCRGNSMDTAAREQNVICSNFNYC